MKKFIFIFLCCGAILCFGDDEKNDLNKKEKDLQRQEKQIAKEMFELRVKLIQKDPNLKKLHDKVMELHRELALGLDSKKEMRELADKFKKVKNSLAEIKQQKDAEEAGGSGL